jgi:hypothetical protein
MLLVAGSHRLTENEGISWKGNALELLEFTVKNSNYTDLPIYFSDLKLRFLQEIGDTDATEIAAKSVA